MLIAILWGLNGAVQSLGWPSVSKVLLTWFPDEKSRATWYALLSTSQNVGAAVVPLLVGRVMKEYGWKSGLYVPGGLAIATGVVIVLFLSGSSPTQDKAPTEAAKVDAKAASLTRLQTLDPLPVSAKAEEAKAKGGDSLQKMLKEQVFGNYQLWLMSFNYFCISIMRQSLNDWGPTFLQEEMQLSQTSSSYCLFLIEAGGKQSYNSKSNINNSSNTTDNTNTNNEKGAIMCVSRIYLI